MGADATSAGVAGVASAGAAATAAPSEGATGAPSAGAASEAGGAPSAGGTPSAGGAAGVPSGGTAGVAPTQLFFFFALKDVKNFIIYNRSIIILSYVTYFFTFRKPKTNLIEIDNDWSTCFNCRIKKSYFKIINYQNICVLIYY